MATSVTKFNVATRRGIPFRTNNADLTPAVTFTTRPSKVYWVEFKAIAMRTQDDSQAYSYWRQACYRTNSAGTVTLVGAIRTVVTDNEDAAGGLFEIDISGADIRLRVAAEGTPTDWLIDSNIQEWDEVGIC